MLQYRILIIQNNIMREFNKFLEELLDNPIKIKGIKVGKKMKRLKGMAMFAGINSPESKYIKISFKDGANMCVIIDDKEVYFGEEILGKAEGITDEMIGRGKVIYNGKEYKLVNKDDYQFTVTRYLGGITDIEGEERFSDYINEESNPVMLSLGWNSYTRKRDDVICELICLEDIDIIR